MFRHATFYLAELFRQIAFPYIQEVSLYKEKTTKIPLNTINYLYICLFIEHEGSHKLKIERVIGQPSRLSIMNQFVPEAPHILFPFEDPDILICPAFPVVSQAS